MVGKIFDILELSEKESLLIEAIYTGDIEQIKKLILSRVELTRIDVCTSPLNIAVETGNIEIVRLLLEAGANPNNGIDLIDSAALDCAAAKGYTDIAKLLIQAGAHISNVNCNPLIMAASAGHLEVVKLLVEEGASVNAYINDMAPPLLSAAENAHQEVFEYLAPLTNPDMIETSKKVALSHASFNGSLEALQLLFKAGMNLNTKICFYDGSTALMNAARGRKPKFVRALLELGVEVNAKDNMGRTALMFAAEAGYITTVKLLLQSDININAKDNEGKTALTYAKQAGDRAIAILLKEVGATE